MKEQDSGKDTAKEPGAGKEHLKTPEENAVVADEKIIEETTEVEAVEKEVALSKEEDIVKKGLSRTADMSAWSPKTELGRKVKAGEINDIDIILDNGLKIMEFEITDSLVQNLESDLLLIGQSKGKFGGGQRRVFRQTQKKTKEGNKPKFATFAIIGNKNGYVGCGHGKAKETVPAREKATRLAKLNIMKIRRGCGSWQCHCSTPHSIPFRVDGKCGTYRIRLMPAPKGTGLCIEQECAKILKIAGIKDVWAKSIGQTKSKINMVKACIEALKKLNQTKIKPDHTEKLGIVNGSIVE